MKGVSVIICCYNSESKLPVTLNHLAKQQILSEINYEIILVDNNCTDNTVEVALSTWNSLGNPFPLTIIKQPLPGLTNARRAGIEKAAYEYVVLCDDDNWLCDDYLYKVFNLFENNPEVALIGGVGEAVSDVAIPTWFYELKGFGYAVGTEGRHRGYVDAIYGAGMAIRKEVFLAIIKNEKFLILTDRKGKSLSSGGDTEICVLVKNAGYKIYLDHSLTFKHFLPGDRLQWSYYLKLRKSFGKATAYLQLYDATDFYFHSIQKIHRLKQFLSIIKFAVFHLKYILFPSYFKNTRCARFFQNINMQLTLLLEYKNIIEAAKRIHKNSEQKHRYPMDAI